MSTNRSALKYYNLITHFVILCTGNVTFLKVKILKNKNVKSEYTRQNMAFVKRTVLQKEELTEEVRKNPLVHDKSHKLPVKPN